MLLSARLFSFRVRASRPSRWKPVAHDFQTFRHMQRVWSTLKPPETKAERELSLQNERSADLLGNRAESAK